MNITNEQREILAKYDIAVARDIDTVLDRLDDKITEIGFNADYELNEVGLKLQLLYDQLYSQN